MQLRILHSQVEKLELKKLGQGTKKGKELKSFDLGFDVQIDPEDNSNFRIIFEIKVQHLNELKLNCIYSVWFEASEPLNAEEHAPMLNINAPAIAFPFLRSLISTVTLNSGFNPAILPSVNFLQEKN
ncbi:MAG: protein-export chaperone SecB [Saprospiraceae bacterium]|nr:protein-export chaperone SecB [Saprospiraceae bacterium]